MCNCNRNLQVIFVCLQSDSECPDSLNLKFYCIECSQEEKHNHKSVAIVSELKKNHSKWLTLKTEIFTFCQKALPAYKEYEPLILYLENAMMEPNAQIVKPVKWLSSEYSFLKTIHDEIVSFYDNQISQLVSHAQLIEISLLNNQFIIYEKQY